MAVFTLVLPIGGALRHQPWGNSHSGIYPPSTVYPPSVVYSATPYVPTSFLPPPPISSLSLGDSSRPPVIPPGQPTVIVPISASPPTQVQLLNSSDSSMNDQSRSREGAFTRGRRTGVRESFPRQLSPSRDEP